MDDVVKLITEALPFWPLVAVSLILSIVGKVLARVVFTKERGGWGYRTLSLQPIAAGMLIGLVWHNPVPGVEGVVESMGCFALSGALSVWAYQVLKGLAKKEGIDLDLPGVDTSPPEGK